MTLARGRIVDVGLGDALLRVFGLGGAERLAPTFEAASGLSQQVLAGVLSGARFRLGIRLGSRGQVVEVGQISDALDLLLAVPR